MSNHDPQVTLRQMQDYGAQATQLCSGRKMEDLAVDRGFRLALERALEVLGEAANRLPQELRLRYPQVAWGQIIGMRNVLVHGYDIINDNTLWDTAQRDVPILLSQIEQILRDLEAGSGMP